MTRKCLGLLIGAGLLSLTGLHITRAGAADDNSDMPPPRPPREAVDACANLQEGATCTVSFHGRSVQGICMKGPGGQEPLACVPPPPPEAVQACANLSEGADCKVSMQGRELEGKCRNSPAGAGPLACVPPPPSRRNR